MEQKKAHTQESIASVQKVLSMSNVMLNKIF